jgi:hypothetical protein
MLSIEIFHLNENPMQYSNYDGVDDLEWVKDDSRPIVGILTICYILTDHIQPSLLAKNIFYQMLLQNICVPSTHHGYLVMGPNSLSTLKFCHNITLLCTLLPSPI